MKEKKNFIVLILWRLLFGYVELGYSLERGLTPMMRSFDSSSSEVDSLESEVPSMDAIKNVAGFGDAHHRGDKWYDSNSKSSGESGNDLRSDLSGSTSDIETDSRQISASSSSEASSVETNERRRRTQVYRTCTPCPHDMMKKHTNVGINWICGGYQRARRTFKSLCMMRYRNCQDGTLFVKLYDHRCDNNTFHGRHWFYVYEV